MFIKRRLTLRVVRMINNYLCLDIGGTSLKSGLIDANGQLQQSLDAVPIAKNKHDFWHQLTATIDRFQGRFVGMAISVPGQVDPPTRYHSPWRRTTIPGSMQLTGIFGKPLLGSSSG